VAKWTAAEIPPLDGRLALVTGGNSGIGLIAAGELAGAGARVVIGARDKAKGAEAVAAIRAEHPEAKVEALELDLASLASVERAAAEINGRNEPLDLLINNAGVMATPELRTEDGFELQLGTNHLGHFALSGRLLDRLLAADAARVVSVASLAHRQGKMDFDNLNWEQGYSRWGAYGRSKLANLLFTFELDRRLRQVDSGAIAVACHPGYSATNLQSSGPGKGALGVVLKPVLKLSNLTLAQSAEKGALPTLYAATAADVEGSDYIGPDGRGEARGHPTRVNCSSRARDADDARRLWEVSIELTGVDYAALG
jgi:NAD(P)-dependent dehydrogenase (short-subunit alcohol dehydrogenase family)